MSIDKISNNNIKEAILLLGNPTKCAFVAPRARKKDYQDRGNKGRPRHSDYLFPECAIKKTK